ncbi:MAG: FtsX-like permease family protein [Candidatus Lokiarchaeota archaeon]|nr:FtsX-like permease family protein [Candidatus Lokiarchaeota archaeon]MBD3340825.1 FtsX-like permease family protein [Candidatus Lokiarchaeota archaeon]
MNLPMSIAIRFFKSNKWQTLLIVIGISIGISVQIFVGILLNSLQSSLINNFIGKSPQITIQSENENPFIEGYDDIIDDLEDFDELTAISAAVDRPGTIQKGEKTINIQLRGFDIDDADEIYDIKDRITDGDEPEEDDEIIIGEELKDELDADEGDSITIFGLRKIGNTSISVNSTFEIVGIFDFESESTNLGWVITTIRAVQTMFTLNDTVTSIEMQVEEDLLFEADQIADDIEDELDLDDEDLEISNWVDQSENLLNGLQSQSLSSYFIQAFVLISVVIGISSVLAISVVQKQRQLGILKAMGITNRTSFLIFLFQGFFLGIFGAIGGISLGIFFLWGFTQASASNFIVINYNPIFISISAAIIIAASTLAALSPALKSSKLDPIEVIRAG